MIRLAWGVWLLAACTSDKPAVTDEPMVDDLKADSLRTPTLRASLVPNETRGDQLTASTRYLGFPIHLDANQPLDLWVGGLASDGSTLDTMAYFYGPKDATGRRGHYLARNDDRSADDSSSRMPITASLGAGDYLIVVTTYAKPDPGQVLVTTDVPRPTVIGGLGPQLPSALAFPRIDPVFALALGNITLDIPAIQDRLALDTDDGVVLASDLASVVSKKVLPSQKPALDASVAAAAPSVSQLGTWSDRAQRLLLGSWPYGSMPINAPAMAQQVQQMVIAAWPGSHANGTVTVNALYLGTARYGSIVEAPVADASGMGWTGRELYDSTGRYLGELQTDFDESD